MKLDRDFIINYVKEYAMSKDYVYAMWLEGSDGLNLVDEYSDLDFWFDVEDSKRDLFIKELVEELSHLGKIDSQMIKITNEIYQSNIHLENTSEYLTIDLAAQNDSRSRDCTCFVKESITEVPKVIFDRKNIITFKEADKIDKELLKTVFEENSDNDRHIKKWE